MGTSSHVGANAGGEHVQKERHLPPLAFPEVAVSPFGLPSARPKAWASLRRAICVGAIESGNSAPNLEAKEPAGAGAGESERDVGSDVSGERTIPVVFYRYFAINKNVPFIKSFEVDSFHSAGANNLEGGYYFYSSLPEGSH